MDEHLLDFYDKNRHPTLESSEWTLQDILEDQRYRRQSDGISLQFRRWLGTFHLIRHADHISYRSCVDTQGSHVYEDCGGHNG